MTVKQEPWRPSVERLGGRLFGGASGRVFRGMATMTAGTGVARLIGLLALPALTRVYDASAFGVLALYAAVIAICVPLMGGSYPLAVPLPRRDATAMNLLALSGGILAVAATVYTILLWAFGEHVFRLAGLEALAPYWFMVPLGLVAACIYDLLSTWATRKRAYAVIARTQVTQSLLGALAKIALGLALIQPLGLLIGHVIQAGSGSGRLGLVFAGDLRGHARKVTRRSLRRTARRYRAFPIYRLPSQLLVGICNHLPVILIGIWFGTALAGQFGLAMIALKIPLFLLTMNMSKAFYAEIAANRDLGATRDMTVYVTKRLAPLGALVAGSAFFLAPALTPLVFGPGWEEVGPMIQCFSIYAGLALLSHSISPLLNVLDAQRTHLLLNGVRLLLIAGVFAAAIGPFGADWLAATVALGGAMAAFELLSLGVMARLLHLRTRQ